MKAKSTIPAKGKGLERPVGFEDLPDILPEITQAEIVEFANASLAFRLARADFEAKRAALTLKLLQFCHCEEGHYFAILDKHSELIIEDRTSLEVGTRRPVIDYASVSSGGAA